MTGSAPRVAFFADSFHEMNGVAITCRQFDAYARQHRLPFLSVHPAPATRLWTEDGVTTLELHRGAASFPLDFELYFDPLLWRHLRLAESALRDFRPDVIHVTGPTDMGILGAFCAYMMGIPLVASWHTNVHQYAAHRLRRYLRFMPRGPLDFAAGRTERHTLDGVTIFYKLVNAVLAPNPDLVAMLERRTGRPVYLCERGVDTQLFHPGRRFRQDGAFTLGYVGRLRRRKNIRFLAEVERALRDRNYRFLIVGEGPQRTWLEKNLRRAEFTGGLEREALAGAYANMDLFVFPALMDTFGNAVQEALASGVPAVVMNNGGPRFLVQTGVTGHVAITPADFIRSVVAIMANPERHQKMREAARASALEASWDRVFPKVYGAYEAILAGRRLRAVS